MNLAKCMCVRHRSYYIEGISSKRVGGESEIWLNGINGSVEKSDSEVHKTGRARESC